AADGEWVQLVAISERHWRAVCVALGYDEWIERFAGNDVRAAHRDVIHGLIAEAIRLRPAAEWELEITSAGGLCRRIRGRGEAWSEPLLADRGLVGEVADPRLRAFPIPVSSLAGRDLRSLPRAPALGEHSRAVAAEAGLDGAEIDRLIAAGA